MTEIVYDEELAPQEYNKLRRQVGWDELTALQAERGLAHTTFVSVARENGKAVGMGRALFDYGYTVYFGDVIIDPAYQGRGIGKEIINRLTDRVTGAASKGDRLMFVLGAAKGKEAFYEKLGFQIRPSEIFGAGMSKWIEVK